MERRDFILSSSATLAAIVSGCRKPEHKLEIGILTKDVNPPGEKIYYNTVFPYLNVPYSISVKTVDSRPIKIDGNDLSYFNHKGTNALIQASLYSLYDPARFNYPTINHQKLGLQAAIEKIKERISEQKTSTQINVFYSNQTSLLLEDYALKINKLYPNVKFFPVNTNREPSHPLYLFKNLFEASGRKPLIISLGYDFLGGSSYSLFYNSYLFKKDNSLKSVKNAEIYVAEPGLTLTGLNAEYRESANLNELIKLKNDIRNLLDGKEVKDDLSPILKIVKESINSKDIILFTADYLGKNTGIDYYQAQGENRKFYYQNNNILDIDDNVTGTKTFVNLFLDCNPLNIHNNKLRRLVELTPDKNNFYLSLYPNELSDKAGNYIPMTHYLESWDVHYYQDRNIKFFQQPVISKLNSESISAFDLLLKIFNAGYKEDEYNYIRNLIKLDGDSWNEVLNKGVFISNEDAVSDNSNKKIIFNSDNQETEYVNSQPYLIITQNPYFLTGKEINNPFLNELPHPVSKQYWGNSAWVNTQTAKNNGIATGDIINISNAQKEIELPVIVMEGIADNLVIVESNFGKSITRGNSIEKLGSYFKKHTCGTNTDRLFAESDDLLIPIKIRKVSNSNIKLWTTLNIQHIELQKPIEQYSSEELEQKKAAYGRKGKAAKNFLRNHKYLREKWEMVIDTASCTGCNSCVIACNIENNIPSLEPANSKTDRTMAWLKVNTYIYKHEQVIKASFQPLMCQHCDYAPCEPVCPVTASTHSATGLNEMVYNRCIGARYCMVNCPYEVRTFNFEDYNPEQNSPINLMLNPDVTVRGRGVSEKCSFCVQRINEANQLINRGNNNFTMTTACQDACPVSAIEFGNVLDTTSKVYEISTNKTIKLTILLEGLGTRPAIHYINKYPVG